MTTVANSRSKSGVVFVSVAPERNGAAIELLHFLRWYKKNGTRSFSLLSSFSGELAADFAEAATTWTASDGHWCPGGLRSHALRKVGLKSLARRAERADLRRSAMRFQPGLIYLNTFSKHNFRLLELLNLQVPVLTHVHEAFLFRRQSGATMSPLLAATRRFIACSGFIKAHLIGEHSIPAGRIDVVHEAIPVGQTLSERSREEIFAELHLPPDAALVAAGGTACWRKGSDVFIELARIICRQRTDVYFAWVGGGGVDELEHDARLLGLSERMRFTGEVAKPVDYFAAADVFVLTSREDPFPLVCLEAAAVGKPIVCFADAGGMPEFVEDDCGYIVPYLDVPAMAERVISLLDCPDCRARMGAAARRKVAERHDINVAAPRILDIIERTIAGE